MKFLKSVDVLCEATLNLVQIDLKSREFFIPTRHYALAFLFSFDLLSNPKAIITPVIKNKIAITNI